MPHVDRSYALLVSRFSVCMKGKWTIMILCAMRDHPVRLSELRRNIPGASKKSIAASLRALTAARIIVRRDMSRSLLHVEYQIADGLRGPVVVLLDHIAEWGSIYELQTGGRIAAQPTDAPGP